MVWEDALQNSEFDGAPEEAPGTVTLNAIGFLVRKTPKMVTLAMDMDPETREVRFTFSIPRKMVREIKELSCPSNS